MKVSMIVPVYNAEHVLFDTLGNMAHQTFFDKYPGEGELILVNDCSTDRSGTILEILHRQFPDRTKVIHLQENCGPGGARNIGVENSSGEFYLFMDCDDIASHSLMEDLYQAVTEPVIKNTIGDTGAEDGDSEGYDFAMAGIKCSKLPNGVYLLSRKCGGILDQEKKNFLIASEANFLSKIYRRSFMEKHGIRFAEHVLAEDEDFSARVHANARSVNMIEKILVEVQDTARSATKTMNPTAGYEDILNCAIRAYQGMRECPDYEEFAQAAEKLYLDRLLLGLLILDQFYQEEVISKGEYLKMTQSLRKLSKKMVTHPVRENAWVKRYMKPENRDRMISFMEKKEGVLLK